MAGVLRRCGATSIHRVPILRLRIEAFEVRLPRLLCEAERRHARQVWFCLVGHVYWLQGSQAWSLRG